MLLLRHASAGERLDDPSLDLARPLDRIGRADSRNLRDAFAGYAIETIVSSPHRRCAETVRPLAEALELDVEVSTALVPDASLRDARALLAQLPEQALVCTHREVIERLFEKRIACEKGGAWIVERRGARFVATEYLPPATTQVRERRLASLARR